MAIPFCRPVKAPPPVYMSEALLLVLPALMTKNMVTATNPAKIARLSQVLPTWVDSSAAANWLTLVLRSFLAGDQRESVHDSLGKPHSCLVLRSFLAGDQRESVHDSLGKPHSCLVLRSFLAGDQRESVHDSLGKPHSCQTLLLH